MKNEVIEIKGKLYIEKTPQYCAVWFVNEDGAWTQLYSYNSREKGKRAYYINALAKTADHLVKRATREPEKLYPESFLQKLFQQ